MGFVDPKSTNDEDEALPGATGLHLDLDLKRCPACRREVTPWQAECPDCGEVAVSSSQVPGSSFPLPPGLLEEEPPGPDHDPDGDRDNDPADDADPTASGGPTSTT